MTAAAGLGEVTVINSYCLPATGFMTAVATVTAADMIGRFPEHQGAVVTVGATGGIIRSMHHLGLCPTAAVMADLALLVSWDVVARFAGCCDPAAGRMTGFTISRCPFEGPPDMAAVASDPGMIASEWKAGSIVVEVTADIEVACKVRNRRFSSYFWH